MSSSYSPNALEEFIQKVPKFQIPDGVKTIFSIGGRGYYENATSDVLAFFMNPDEAHGLKELFLSSYFDVMGIAEKPNFSGVRIEREVATVENKRIDLQIVGSDWCLLIENKIWHIQNNPFELYEKHASERFSGFKYIYSVLSPDGKSETEKWKGVSYRDYCHRLDSALSNRQTKSDPKWLLFAKEFVLHLKNEVYTKAMNIEQIAFVESHLHEVDEVLKLKDAYRKLLLEEFKSVLSEILHSHEIRMKDESWAIRGFFDGMRGWNIALWWEPHTDFMVSAYLPGMTSEQMSKANEFFKSWTLWPKEPGTWYSPGRGCKRRDDAMQEIKNVAAFMCKLHVPEQRPVD